MKGLPLENNLQRGQALLIVLLTMAVILTVVLSVASRSVTDISLTALEEDALRAFSAAEAGVEEALIVGGPASGTLPGGSTFTADIPIGVNVDQFVYPAEILSGETVTFWFVSQDTEGNPNCTGEPCFRGSRLNVCWGKTSSETPAVEVSIFYDGSASGQEVINNGNYSDVEVERFAYDPNTVRNDSNNFSDDAGSCNIGGQNFLYSSGFITLPPLIGPCNPSNTKGCILMTRIRTFYNATDAHPVGIEVTTSGDGELPTQGIQIESTGVAGDSTRKIEVFRSYSEPPPIFDSSIFSGTDITK